MRGIVTGDHKHGGIAQIFGGLPPRQLFEVYLEDLNSREKPTVIMIDEIAIFALRIYRQQPERLEVFLSELREARENFKNIRWLLTGSIGLDWVARNGEAEGTLNDLVPYPFTPFDIKAARAFVDQFISEGGTLTPFMLDDEAFDYLVAELGWLSPYYLEALASEIRPSVDGPSQDKAIANKNDVMNAFDALLAHHNRNYFSSWREHLSKNVGSPLKERLHTLLETCARTRHGEEFDTLLATLAGEELSVSRKDVRSALDILINDGYLSEDIKSGRFRFTSGLLRRWWWRWMCGGSADPTEGV